jgi:DNA-binding transcriptional LysR family regulator
MIIYNEVVEENIELVHLGDEMNILVESVKHRSPEIFLDHDSNDQTTTRYLKKAGIRKSSPRRFLDDVYGLIDGVKAGLGRAVIPWHLITDDPEIRILDLKNQILFPVNLYFYKKSYPSKLHGEVLKHLNAGAKVRLK